MNLPVFWADPVNELTNISWADPVNEFTNISWADPFNECNVRVKGSEDIYFNEHRNTMFSVNTTIND